MSYVFSFEKLEVFELARKLVSKIYKITESFPNSEQYGLISQMRRASISVVSNIAEGSSRTMRKDHLRFLQISFSSLTELLCQTIISNDLKYLDKENCEILRSDIEELTNKLNSLYNYRQKKFNSKSTKLSNQPN